MKIRFQFLFVCLSASAGLWLCTCCAFSSTPSEQYAANSGLKKAALFHNEIIDKLESAGIKCVICQSSEGHSSLKVASVRPGSIGYYKGFATGDAIKNLNTKNGAVTIERNHKLYQVNISECSEPMPSLNSRNAEIDVKPQYSGKTSDPLSSLITLQLPQPVSLAAAAFSTPDGKRGWVTKLDGVVKMSSTPSCVDGTIYVGGGLESTEMYAFSLAGKLLWKSNTKDNGPTFPVIGNGYCVYNTESCTLCVDDAHTGQSVWSKDFVSPLQTAPALDGDSVFVIHQGLLESYDLLSGGLLWKQTLWGQPITAPVVANGKVYVACTNRWVVGYDATTGAQVSRISQKVASAPLVVAGHVIDEPADYDNARYGNWEKFGYEGARPAYLKGLLIQVNGDAVEAINLSTHQVRWRSSLGRLASGSLGQPFSISAPSIGQRNVYVTTSAGHIICLRQEDGGLEFCYQTHEHIRSQPCLSGGYIIISSDNGRLICINVGEDASGWEQWGGNAHHNLTR